MAYASVADYRARAGVLTGVDDATLAVQLDAVSEYLDQRLGRSFGLDAQATPRYFAGSGSVLWIDDCGAAPTAIEADLDGDGVYELAIPSTAVFLEPANALARGWPVTRLVLRSGNGVLAAWPKAPQSVRVTARWGWPAVPGPIREATVVIVRQLRDLGLGGVLQAVTQLDAAVQRSDVLPGLIRDLVREYGRVRWVA